eukprot:gene35-biopygen8828
MPGRKSCSPGLGEFFGPVLAYYCTRPGLVKWLDHILDNVPVPVKSIPTDNDRFVLATDASVDGWGGVLFDSKSLASHILHEAKSSQ